VFELRSRGIGDKENGIGRNDFKTNQERIIQNEHGNGKGDTSMLKIKHDVTFTVEESHYNDEPSPSSSIVDGTNMNAGRYQTSVETRKYRGGSN
jgi:hypothetical protein